jgi:CheY-like chemotaxis protein
VDTRSNGGGSRILCVESDSAVLESRCAVLEYSGYDVASASPETAEILLRKQKIDLLVVSSLNDRDLQRVVRLCDGAAVLVLDGITMPSELLRLVAERLNIHHSGELSRDF